MDLKREDIVQNLELQLSELEMLNSMFPDENEFRITDPGVVTDIQDCIAEKMSIDQLPKLEYVLSQVVQNDRLEISISLPISYPDVPPQVSVQCPKINRSNHEAMNSELREYVSTLESGTLCVAMILDWVKENHFKYNTVSIQPISAHDKNVPSNSEPLRLWIHSHHIYSKTKISNIQQWAKDKNLRGFLLPGKPGFICVEGDASSCQEWWQQVRSMNWQKISCKLEEHDCETRFKTFENIATIRKSDQSDMKAFLRYLDDHASSHVFKEFFGFDGK